MSGIQNNPLCRHLSRLRIMLILSWRLPLRASRVCYAQYRRTGRSALRCLSSTTPPVDEEAEKAAALEEVKKILAENNRSVTPDHVYDIPDGLGPPLPSDPTEVATLDGQPALQRSRTVLISQKAQSAMTSVGHKSKAWVLHWKVEERWSNPLMGWTSTADPLSNLELKFETADQAIAFATKNGWKYEVDEPIEHRNDFGQNKYSHNFLPKAAENEIKAINKKTKLFKFSKPYSSHYFRPLKYHGEAEVRQHGLNPYEPWK